jgi:hypothetical protein
MRITRLALTEIRRHRHLELRPAPGLTVIRGPNESGKSTIQLALELVLFRRATTTAAEFTAVRSWDATGDPEIELEFDLDGKPGRLIKRFAGSRGSVRLEVDGAVDTDPGRVDHLLAEATGLPSEKFFRSTASVRHFEMEDLDRDERALRDRLQASIGGGDVGASTARRRLDEAIRRMRAAGARNPGPLRVAADDIARLTAELRAGEAALERLSADRAALAAATAARVALDEEVRAVTDSLGAAETAVALEADRRALAAQYEHYRRATDLAERLADAEAHPPTQLPLATLRPAVERLRNLAFLSEQQAGDLAAATTAATTAAAAAAAATAAADPATTAATTATTAAAAGPEPGVDGRDGAVPSGGPTLVLGGPSTPISGVGPASQRRDATGGGTWKGIAAALAIAALAALVLGPVALGPSLGLVISVVLGALAAVAWMRGGRASADLAARDARLAAERALADRAAAEAAARDLAALRGAQRAAEQASRLDAAARAEATRTQLEARLSATRTEASGILAQLDVVDLAAAESLLGAAEGHAGTVDGLRAELKGLLGTAEPMPPDALRAARDDAAARAAMGGHALDGLGAAGADPESARLRAQAALRAARHRQGVAIEEQGRAAGRVSQNTEDAERVAALAERLATRTDELAVLERRVRIYDQTLTAIIAAEAATMQKAARYLERQMGVDIGRITGGRYERVRVDENDLTITVWSPEREAWIDAALLSKGTADQLYLAARLGLVRQVTQDRHPPLVFDDPFVTFDDERAVRAIALLRELAADHQVLYLTCSDRYDAVADLVIELPAPGLREVVPETTAVA